MIQHHLTIVILSELTPEQTLSKVGGLILKQQEFYQEDRGKKYSLQLSWQTPTHYGRPTFVVVLFATRTR